MQSILSILHDYYTAANCGFYKQGAGEKTDTVKNQFLNRDEH